MSASLATFFSADPEADPAPLLCNILGKYVFRIFFNFFFIFWIFDFFNRYNSCVLSWILISVFYFLFITCTCINYTHKNLKTRFRAHLKIIAYLSPSICNAVWLFLIYSHCFYHFVLSFCCKSITNKFPWNFMNLKWKPLLFKMLSVVLWAMQSLLFM